MFLRATKRIKDGKEHRYWSVVENRRVSAKRVVQQTLLYLGEINDSQHTSWVKALDVFEDNKKQQVSLFPEDRAIPPEVRDGIQLQLKKLSLHNPRQWGGCFVSLTLWEQLGLDEFWAPRMKKGRKGTDWLSVLKSLVTYHLLDPGSEWRMHRVWFEHTALRDLLGYEGKTIEKNTLYRCLDRLVEHKDALTEHLVNRWKMLFDASFEVLLYDLTSTYFESDPPFQDGDKRRFGYSRDKRSDCVQVVVALIVTPEGFPISYEVLSGNTIDNSTLRPFLEKIEKIYGKAKRVWVMDRGIPTEDILSEMRSTNVSYLVGTTKGKLTKLEKEFLTLPWEKAQNEVQVKLLSKEGELLILARSPARQGKERGMRKRRLKILWARLKEIQSQNLTRDALQRKIGAAQKEAGRVASLVSIAIPDGRGSEAVEGFTFSLNRARLKERVRREGHYILRSNLPQENAADLWKMYIQLTNVENAFRTLKSDLAIRPVFHKKENRIEAHIFVVFLAYCLQVTLQQRAKNLASGLSARAILEQFKHIQMIDVSIPTTDGRALHMSRFTSPNQTQALLCSQLKFKFPLQPPPQITNVSTCL